MSSKSDSTNGTAEREVIITRIFDAPRELVFKAWTDPEHLMHWYASKGCTLDVYKLDFRPGGVFQHCIRNPKAHAAFRTKMETLSSLRRSEWTPTGREKRL